jgi:hypothetical protein
MFSCYGFHIRTKTVSLRYSFHRKALLPVIPMDDVPPTILFKLGGKYITAWWCHTPCG